MRALATATVLLLASQGAGATGKAGCGESPCRVAPPLVPAAVASPDACPPALGVYSRFSGLHVQLGRVVRDQIPSTCPGKAYPGTYNPLTPYYFETFTYDNTSATTACVTVDFDTFGGLWPCLTNSHISAYADSYDPLNQAVNFLGDVGWSVSQPFSFAVAGLHSMVLVVTNTSFPETCDFGFRVHDLPCTLDADLELTKSASSGSAPVGSEIVFTLSAGNRGPSSAASSVVVTDTLPSGLSYQVNDCGAGFASPLLTWNIGTMERGALVSCRVTAVVSAAGTFFNAATASSPAPDSDPTNNIGTAEVTGVSSVVEVPALTGPGTLALLLSLCWASVALLRRCRPGPQ